MDIAPAPVGDRAEPSAVAAPTRTTPAAPAPRVPRRLWQRPLVLVALALACLPLVVTVTQAGTHDYLPVGDNAIIATRSGDVFSTNSPSLGMPSTLSAYDGGEVSNHPGPALFWALAVPYTLSGHSAVGFLAGVLAVQLASVVIVASVANRRGGPALALPALLAVAVLAWALDGPSLTITLNPFLTVLPFLAYLFLCSDVAAGNQRSLPLAVAVGSLCAQGHTSFGLVVALVGLVAVAGLAWSYRTRWRHDGGGDRGPVKRSLLLTAAVTAAVALTVWAPPLWQQFTSSRPNLSAILSGLSPGSGTRRPTSGFALDSLGATLGFRPLWAGREPRLPVDAYGTVAGTPVIVLGLLVGLAGWAWWQRRRALAWLLTVSIVATVAGYLSARSAPNSLDPQSFRYLWAIGPFVWVGVAWGATQVLRRQVRALRAPEVRQAVAGAAVAAVLVASVAASTGTDPTSDDANLIEAASRRATTALTPELMARLDPDRAYAVGQIGGIAFLSIGPGLIRNLEQHGFDLRVLGDPWVYGQGRSDIEGVTEVIDVVTDDELSAGYQPSPNADLIGVFRTTYRQPGPDGDLVDRPLDVRVYRLPLCDIPPYLLPPEVDCG